MFDLQNFSVSVSMDDNAWSTLIPCDVVAVIVVSGAAVADVRAVGAAVAVARAVSAAVAYAGVDHVLLLLLELTVTVYCIFFIEACVAFSVENLKNDFYKFYPQNVSVSVSVDGTTWSTPVPGSLPDPTGLVIIFSM
jgi:hypothetical protein